MRKPKISRETVMRTVIENAVNTFIRYSGKQRGDFFTLVGISSPTFSRRLRNPHEFSLAELERISALAGTDVTTFVQNLYKENQYENSK